MFRPKLMIKENLARHGVMFRDEVKQLIDQRINELGGQIQELINGRDAAWRREMDQRETAWSGQIQSLRTELLSMLFRSRQAVAQSAWPSGMPMSRPDRASPPLESFEDCLAKMRSIHPRLFETWSSMNFNVNMDEYRERPLSSCSIAEHKVAPLFGGFIAPYLRGKVLDVGCGPYAVPIYLAGYPIEMLSGIDPIAPFEPHPFEFVRGFAEFLPWNESTFEVVIAATSLDHVLSLEKTFSEILRVLKPGGSFLVWEGFVKGSPPYTPDSAAFQPSDKFHLFHFDEEWFEKAVESSFHIREKLTIDGASYFYCLGARK